MMVETDLVAPRTNCPADSWCLFLISAGGEEVSLRTEELFSNANSVPQICTEIHGSQMMNHDLEVHIGESSVTNHN